MGAEGDTESLQQNGASTRPNVQLLGVGHVFDLKASIRDIIYRARPEVVALELDPARLNALLSKRRGVRGNAPFIYRMLGRFQQNLADQFGGEVGSEMMAAAEAAGDIGSRLALIDMDAVTVFNRMRRTMTLREKLSMLFGGFLSLFARKSTIERELKEYHKNEEIYLGELSKRYPSIVKILIDDRNAFMAEKLRAVASDSRSVLAVVGDGHVSGLSRLLADFADVEVLRLEELRSHAERANAELTISFELPGEDNL